MRREMSGIAGGWHNGQSETVLGVLHAQPKTRRLIIGAKYTELAKGGNSYG